MDPMTPRHRIAVLAEKYKYPLAILVIGLCLMLLPANRSTESVPEPSETSALPSLEETLESILSQIQGAGQVQVLLTMESGRETRYQTDVRSAKGSDSQEEQLTTIIVENDQREETGLIRQTLEPCYRGAVVVCQGAEDPNVRLAVVQAVSCATGLGADEICVLKMK